MKEETKVMLSGLFVEFLKGVMVLMIMAAAMYRWMASVIDGGRENFTNALGLSFMAAVACVLVRLMESQSWGSQWAVWMYSFRPFRVRFIPVGDHMIVCWPIVRGWQAIVIVSTVAMIAWYGEMALFSFLPTWLAAAINVVPWSLVVLGSYAWYRQWRLNRGVQHSPERAARGFARRSAS